MAESVAIVTLPPVDDTAMEVAMSEMSLVERGALAASTIFGHDPDAAKQYGVKGMKWGVRNDKGHEGERVKTKKLEKLDKKWEKSIYTTDGAMKVHNAMADHFNSRIGALNDRHPDADYRKGEDTPEWKSYMDDVMKLESEGYAKAVTSVHGVNPSGTKKAVYVEDENGARIEVRDAEVKHAANEEEPDLVLLLKRSNGKIVEMNQAETAAEHSDASEKFLAHYGVKGMKWGVRKTDSAAKTAAKQEVKVTQKKPGTFAKTKGGKKLPISEDAEEALRLRQKARGSTTDALSNKELQTAISRMNLEQQYSNLAFQSDRRSRGARFVAGLMGDKRYGKKRVFTDNDEEMGEKVRKAVESYLASKS